MYRNKQIHVSQSHPAGWAVFRRGNAGHHGKTHFMQEDKWFSICGFLKLMEHEKKYIRFVKDGEFAKRKTCDRCLSSAKALGILLN